jgi:hypothetical protein
LLKILIEDYQYAFGVLLNRRKQSDIIQNSTWKGTGNFTLDQYCDKNRNAHEQLTLAAEHVPYQLLNEFTLVTKLLNDIETSDAALSAIIASVSTDKDPSGMRFNCERTVAHIAPCCPVQNRNRKPKRIHAEVSGVSAAPGMQIGATEMRQGIGKTGVHFRSYKKPEYLQLTKAQLIELYAWRQSPEGKAANASQDPRRSKKRKTVPKSTKMLRSRVLLKRR